MAGLEEILLQLTEYTEEEKVYKKFYELKSKDPAAYQDYLCEMKDYVHEHRILIFDYPDIHHPELITERDFYTDLSISHSSNVNVVRHLRYTPVFWHSHSFFTVLYVLKGSCGHKVGNLDLPLNEGDIFFLPPYVKQTIEVFDDSIILNLHIRKDTFSDVFFNTLRYDNILSDFFMSCLYSKKPVRGMLFHTAEDLEIQNLFLELYKEKNIDDLYSWWLLNNMVAQLFAKILRGYAKEVQFINSAAGSTKNKTLQILSYIHDHYRSITLQELADHFHYSVPHCSKLIREETETGFTAFVRQIKMQHAADLLKSTRYTIAEITDMVGYENQETLIRVFKKTYGMTPSEYRKSVNSVF